MYEPANPKSGVKRLWCDFPLAETRRVEQEERTLKVVDFLWQPAEATWLVEIKDPEGAPGAYRTEAVSATLSTLASGMLVDEHFLPKLFGTYVWLAREGLLRPVAHRYAVLIGMDRLDAALRLAAGDRVQRSIDAVGPVDRASGRAPFAEVHDLRSWNALPSAPQITREP